jgi:carbamoyl-phosphate synthase large subunit
MALRHNFTIDEIHELTKIDRWFLYKLKNITDIHSMLSPYGRIEDLPDDLLREAKKRDFPISR